ncbi:hypothetical protein AB0N03_52235, partial [Amycolatopsis sp. NPDC051061]
LEAFAHRLAQQWQKVPAGVRTVDIRIQAALPTRELKYRDAVLDHVSEQLRLLLRGHGVDSQDWLFNELVRRSPGLEARVSVTVMPTPLLTEAQVRSASFWQGGFLNQSAVTVGGVPHREGNELSRAMQRQVRWRVREFAARAPASRAEGGAVLLIEFAAVNQGQAQARQKALDSLVREELEGVPGGVNGWLQERVRYQPIAGTPWAPGVDLRLEESAADVDAAPVLGPAAGQELDEAASATELPGTPAPAAAGPVAVDEDAATPGPAGETGPVAFGVDDFAAFLQDYEANLPEAGDGFGDLLFGDEAQFDIGGDAFGFGFAGDGAPTLAGDYEANLPEAGDGFGDLLFGDEAQFDIGGDAFG